MGGRMEPGREGVGGAGEAEKRMSVWSTLEK